MRFIGEDDYKSVQNEYRRAKGQTEDVYDRGAGREIAEETREQILFEITSYILKALTEGTVDEGMVNAFP